MHCRNTTLMPECDVRACKSSEIFDDPGCAALFAEYTEECANALLGKPAPRREVYANLEATGFAQCFAAYHGATLRGFALVLATVVPHFGIRSATVESLFVSRVARHTGLGGRLMVEVERYATWTHCDAIFYTAPVASELDLLLSVRPAAYRLTNHVYTKRLA